MGPTFGFLPNLMYSSGAGHLAVDTLMSAARSRSEKQISLQMQRSVRLVANSFFPLSASESGECHRCRMYVSWSVNDVRLAWQTGHYAEAVTGTQPFLEGAYASEDATEIAAPQFPADARGLG